MAESTELLEAVVDAALASDRVIVTHAGGSVFVDLRGGVGVSGQGSTVEEAETALRDELLSQLAQAERGSE